MRGFYAFLIATAAFWAMPRNAQAQLFSKVNFMKKLRILLAALVSATILTLSAQAQEGSGTIKAANGTPVFNWTKTRLQNDVDGFGGGRFHHTLTITPLVPHVRITNIQCNGLPTGLAFESMPNNAGGNGGPQALEWDDDKNTDKWAGHIQWAGFKKPHKDQSSEELGEGLEQPDDQEDMTDEGDGSLTDDEG